MVTADDNNFRRGREVVLEVWVRFQVPAKGENGEIWKSRHKSATKILGQENKGQLLSCQPVLSQRGDLRL